MTESTVVDIFFDIMAVVSAGAFLIVGLWDVIGAINAIFIGLSMMLSLLVIMGSIERSRGGK